MPAHPPHCLQPSAPISAPAGSLEETRQACGLGCGLSTQPVCRVRDLRNLPLAQPGRPAPASAGPHTQLHQPRRPVGRLHRLQHLPVQACGLQDGLLVGSLPILAALFCPHRTLDQRRTEPTCPARVHSGSLELVHVACDTDSCWDLASSSVLCVLSQAPGRLLPASPSARQAVRCIGLTLSTSKPLPEHMTQLTACAADTGFQAGLHIPWTREARRRLPHPFDAWLGPGQTWEADFRVCALSQAVPESLGQGTGAGVGHSGHDLHWWLGHLRCVGAASARVLLGGEHHLHCTY